MAYHCHLLCKNALLKLEAMLAVGGDKGCPLRILQKCCKKLQCNPSAIELKAECVGAQGV